MTTTQTTYLSREKREAFTKELEELKTVKRREIAEQLEFAKSLGDLSENAEYHEARDAQAALEERISKIEELLKNAQIISENRDGSIIDVGSTVSLRDNKGTEEVWSIVGSEEVNVLEKRISNESPLGRLLVGKEKGEKVVLETPRGKVEYEIVGVR
jgi:transcription elongation factor GreA